MELMTCKHKVPKKDCPYCLERGFRDGKPIPIYEKKKKQPQEN